MAVIYHNACNHKVKRPLQNISHVSSLVYDRWEGAPTGTCTRRSGRTAPILRSTLSSRSKAQASPCPPAERSRSVWACDLDLQSNLDLDKVLASWGLIIKVVWSIS